MKRKTSILLLIFLIIIQFTPVYALENDAVPSTVNTDEVLVLVEENTRNKEIKKIANNIDGDINEINELSDGTKLISIETDSATEAQDILQDSENIIIVQPNYKYDLCVEEVSENDSSTNDNLSEPDDPQEENSSNPKDIVEHSKDNSAAEKTEKQENIDLNSETPAESQSQPEIPDKSDKTLKLNSTPNDPYFDNQWYLDNSSNASAQFSDAWDLLTSNRQVTVAVIDTGVELNHPDLDGVIIENKCTTFNNGQQGSFTDWDNAEDDNGHGTHVCGTIGAVTNNAEGVAGTSYNRAKIFCIDAADLQMQFSSQDVVLSIDYAVDNGAQIINMSFGAAYEDKLIAQTIKNAYDNGVISICAAGNENIQDYVSPADSPCAISVMNHNSSGNKASTSNYGIEKDVSATGASIYNTWINNRYSSQSGTSMATPVTSGLAVLLLSEDNTLTPRQIKNFIYSSSNAGDYSSFGFGKINAKNAINNLHATPQNPTSIVLNKSSMTMGVNQSLYIEHAIYPATASREDVSISSSDTSVATVDEYGVVKAKGPGTAVITFSSHGTTATCDVTVKDITYKEVTILPYDENGSLTSDDDIVVVNPNTNNEFVSRIDGYKKKLAKNERITVTVNSNNFYTALRLYDQNNTLVKSSYYTEDTLPASSSFTYTAPTAGYYYLQVFEIPSNSTSKDYTLRINHVHSIQKVNKLNPTCTEDGYEDYYKCTLCDGLFSDATGTTPIESIPVLNKLNHDWDTPTYEWNSDNSKVTATRVCKRDSSHKETETVNTTSETTGSSCDAITITYTSNAFNNDAFEIQTKQVQGESGIHDWSQPTYIWNNDNTKVTATRICNRDSSHKETETANTTSQITQNPTCAEAGERTYTATFDNEAFQTQTKKVSIPKTEHDWDTPTYKWNDDNTKVTATRICKNNNNHKETETVNTTSVVSKVATCSEEGEKTFTAVFENEAFESQTKKVSIPKTEHSWNEPTYKWNNDNSKVTATRTCSKNDAHKETETVDTTSVISKTATCSEEGERTYTAVFKNEAFESQTKKIAIPKAEHNWDNPTYTWNNDNTKVTATKVCKNNNNHKETETTNTTSVVSKEPSCSEEGEKTYTATFDNEAFQTQTKKVAISKAEHSWDAPSYKWNDDNSKVTATKVCKNNNNHKETETVGTTSITTEGSTCGEAGSVTYTTKPFDNDAFKTQTKTISTEALPHDWDAPTYEWTDGNTKVTATRACKRNSNHKETETVDVTSVTTASTCSQAGNITYTSENFTNQAFKKQTKVVEIPKTNHDWDNPTYVWSNDNSQVTATRICKNNSNHKETETAETTASTSEGTVCGEAGTITYTTKQFNNNAFTQQKKTVTGEVLQHDWNTPTYTWDIDNMQITATRVCKRDSSHKETETVAITASTKNPTCTENGSTTYTSKDFSNQAFTKQTKTTSIPAINHNWDNPTYSWSNDNTKVTATKVCKNNNNHKQTETVETTNSTSEGTVCGEAGTVTYTTKQFSNNAFTQQKKTVTGEVLQHDWNTPTYTWDINNMQITATRVCKRDSSHKETETVAITASTKNPTCTENGKTTYTSKNFANQAFTKQTKVVEIPKINHNWGTPTYEWNSNNTKVTATRICLNDASHKQTETVDVTKNITKPATCFEDGEAICTSKNFSNTAFTVQTKTGIEPKLNHKWSAVTYNWNSNNTEVTATRTCQNDSSHKETETVSATSQRTKEPTCSAEGTITYISANFSNPAFSVHKKTQSIPKTEHSWNEPTYKWNDDNTKVTATRTCKFNSSHKETETVSVTSKINKNATYTTSGNKICTSNAFNNSSFSVQTKTVSIPATGHNSTSPTRTTTKTSDVSNVSQNSTSGDKVNSNTANDSTVSKAAKTGDATNVLIYIAIAIVAIAGIFAMKFKKNK